ncbi:MAG: hypothetical protein ACR2M3_16095 [Thermomicrobiales bacterium]
MTIRAFWIRQRPRVVAICGATLLIVVVLIGLISVGAAPDTSTGKRATVLSQRYATERATLPPDKQAHDDIGATKLAVAILTPPRPVSLRNTPLPLPSPVPITGIVDSRQNPFHRKQAVENSFFGSLNSEHVAIFAGASEDDLMQGVIGVATGQEGSNSEDAYQEYLTPTKHGWVRITAVAGTQVTLVAKDGTPFTFDLNTRTFK